MLSSRYRRVSAPQGLAAYPSPGSVDDDCLPRDRVREKVGPPRLSCEVIRRRGGDPFVGLKLPQMLTNAGLSIGGVTVAQPADIDGDAKLLNALTMENMADAVVSESLATPR